MARPELGTKHDCPNCGAKFYDLNRNPFTCPKCGSEFVAEALAAPVKPIRAPAAAPPAPRKPAAAEKYEEEVDIEVADDEIEVDEETEEDLEEDVELVTLEEAEPKTVETEDEDIPDLGDAELDEDVDDDDETFLEEEEDEDDDVTGIVGDLDDEER